MKFEPIEHSDDSHEITYVRNQRRTIVTANQIYRIINSSNFSKSAKDLVIDYMTHTSNNDIVEGLCYMFECAFGFYMDNFQPTVRDSSHYKCSIDVIISTVGMYPFHPIYWDGDSMHILSEEYLEEIADMYGEDVNIEMVDIMTYIMYQVLYTHFGVHNLYGRQVRFDIYYETGLLYLRNLYELE